MRSSVLLSLLLICCGQPSEKELDSNTYRVVNNMPRKHCEPKQIDIARELAERWVSNLALQGETWKLDCVPGEGFFEVEIACLPLRCNVFLKRADKTVRGPFRISCNASFCDQI